MRMRAIQVTRMRALPQINLVQTKRHLTPRHAASCQIPACHASFDHLVGDGKPPQQVFEDEPMLAINCGELAVNKL